MYIYIFFKSVFSSRLLIFKLLPHTDSSAHSINVSRSIRMQKCDDVFRLVWQVSFGLAFIAMKKQFPWEKPLAGGVKLWLNSRPVIRMQEAEFHVPPRAAPWVRVGGGAPARWNRADGERTPRSCMPSSPSLAEGDTWHHLACEP